MRYNMPVFKPLAIVLPASLLDSATARHIAHCASTLKTLKKNRNNINN
tara:strand:- start:532 stop:675 length:144 start_codon:yes stop_codon:yes gene_type:complete